MSTTPTLTPRRKQVLALLQKAGQPLGAYDLTDQCATITGKRPAPISVYRALDFLVEQGLVHRLASQNTFLACRHLREHQHEGEAHTHADAGGIFLICTNCHRVDEILSSDIHAALDQLADTYGFLPTTHMIEVGGVCEKCRRMGA